jgi:glycosyltransferase involved in cell wall biosynthesis
MDVSNSKLINVLFLIYDLDRGGPELRLLDFAKYFPKNINIHIIVTSENLALLRDFQDRNVMIKVIPINRVYFSPLKILKIIFYIRKHDLRIINLFDLKGLFIASIINLIVFFKFKLIFHNVNSLVELSKKQIWIFHFLLKFCTACVCNSKFSKNEIKNIFPSSKTSIIHNGLHSKLFKRNMSTKNIKRSNLGIKNHELVLGIIANFRKQKNYPFLIEAFETLSDKYQNLKLVCVGGGKYFSDIQLLVTKRRLNKNVIFTGYTEYIIDYLNAIDILVLPSLWEGLPNAIMQGMSMEIPVVVSDVGGCSEIVCHMENGMLFPSNDIGKFTSCLEKLINNKSLAEKLGQNARKTIEDKFTMDLMIKKYASFYRELSTN